MSARWLVIKYVPDPRRNEPRNVGVVAHVNGETSVRLLGVDEDWRVDGHQAKRVVNSVRTYRGWVKYWKSIAGGPLDEWLDQRAVDNYRVVAGGEVVVGAERLRANDLAEELFRDLVAERKTKAPFQQQVKRLLSEANLLQDKQHFFTDYPVTAGKFPFTVPYAWSNGLTTVAEQLGRYDDHRAEAIIGRFEALDREMPEVQRVVILDPAVGQHDDDRVRALYQISHPVTVDSAPAVVREAFTTRIA